MADPCPVCRGTPSRNAKESCICGGAGSLASAYHNLSQMYLRERNEYQEDRDALRSMQKAVLGFVTHPRFRKLDEGHWFRRYWEEHLDIKLVCNVSGWKKAPSVSVRKLQDPEETGLFKDR